MPERTLTVTAKGQDQTGGLVSGLVSGFGIFGTAMGVVTTVANTLVTTLSAGLGVLASFAISSTLSSIQIESAYAGVIKTTEGLSDEFGVLTDAGILLKQAFMDLSAEIPVDVVDLMKIGEIGGQMGIAKEELIDFTETIALLGVTTNLFGEDAALVFGKLSNIMQTVEFDRMGSSVVDLGNNFATTESEIVNFSRYIAAAGTSAGMSAADIFGIAAAFSAVGVRAERGGTAVQKVIDAIQTSVETYLTDPELGAGPKLTLFAETAGLAAEDFVAAWETDPAMAFAAFVKGLGKEGVNAAQVLKDLELGDQRLIQAFRSLSSAGDLVTDAIILSNKAWAENTALVIEAQKRFGTVESKVDLLENIFIKFAVAVGENVRPALSDLLDAILPVAASLAVTLPIAISKVLQPLLDVLVVIVTGVVTGLAAFAAGLEAGKTPLEAFTDALALVAPPVVLTMFEDLLDFFTKIGTAIDTFKTALDLGLTPLDAFEQALTTLVPPGLWDALELVFDVIERIILGIDTFIMALGFGLSPWDAFVQAIYVAIPHMDLIVAGLKGAAIGIALFASALAIAALPTMLGKVILAFIGISLGAIAVIAAGAALGVAWAKDWLGIRTTITEAWDTDIKPALEGIKDWLEVQIPIGIAAIKLLLEGDFKGAWGVVKDAWTLDVDSIKTLLTESFGLAFVTTITSAFSDAISSGIKGVVTDESPILDSLTTMVSNLTATLITALSDDPKPMSDAFKDGVAAGLDDYGKNLVDQEKALKNIIVAIAKGATASFKEDEQSLASAIAEGYTGVIRLAITKLLGSVWEFVKGLGAIFTKTGEDAAKDPLVIADLIIAISDMWSGAINGAVKGAVGEKTLRAVADYFTGVIEDALAGADILAEGATSVKDWIGKIWDSVFTSDTGDVEKDIGNWLSDTYENAVTWVKDSSDLIASQVAAIKAWFAKLWASVTMLGHAEEDKTTLGNWIGDLVEDALGLQSVIDRVKAVGTGISGGIAKGIEAGKDLVSSAVSNIVSAVIGTATSGLKEDSPSKVFEEIGLNVMIGFAKGMTKHQGDILDDIGKFVLNIVSAFSAIASIAKGAGGEVPDLSAYFAQYKAMTIEIIQIIDDLNEFFGYDKIKKLQNTAKRFKVIWDAVVVDFTALKTIVMPDLALWGAQAIAIGETVIGVINHLEHIFGYEGLEDAAALATHAQSIMGSLSSFIDAVSALSEYEDAGSVAENARMLADRIVEIATALSTAADAMEGVATEYAADIYGNVEAMIGPITGAIEAIDALFEYEQSVGLSESAEAFAYDIRELATTLANVVKIMDVELLKAAGDIMSATGAVVSPIESGIEAINAVLGYTHQVGIMRSAMAFGYDIRELAVWLSNVVKVMDVDLLTAAGDIMSAADKVVSPIESGIEAIDAVLGYTHQVGIMRSAWAFGFDIRELATSLSAVVKVMDIDLLTSAGDIMDAALQVVTPIECGIAAINAVLGYTHQVGIVRSAWAFGFDIRELAVSLAQVVKVMDVDLLTTAGDILSAADRVVSPIASGIEAIEAVLGYTHQIGIMRAAFAFGYDIRELAVSLANVVKILDVDLLTTAGNIFAAISNIVSPISAGVEALQAVLGYEATAGLAASADAFAADLVLLAESLEGASSTLDIDTYTAAVAIYDAISTIVGIVEPGIEALEALLEYTHEKGIPALAAEFSVDILAIAEELRLAAVGLDTTALDAAKVAYEAILSIVEVVEPGIDALKTLLGYTTDTRLVARSAAFTWDLKQVAEEFRIAAETLDLEAYVNAQDMYDTIFEIVDVALEALMKLSTLLYCTKTLKIVEASEQWLLDLQGVFGDIQTAAEGMETLAPYAIYLATGLFQMSTVLTEAIASLSSIEAPGTEGLFQGLLDSFLVGATQFESVMQNFFSRVTELIYYYGIQWSRTAYDAGWGIAEAIAQGVAAGSDASPMIPDTLRPATRRTETPAEDGGGIHVTVQTTADPQAIVEGIKDASTAGLMGAGTWRA